jgi:hypothetical protein
MSPSETVSARIPINHEFFAALTEQEYLESAEN